VPDLSLSLAISYYDHVVDVVRGKVRPEGISLIPSELPNEEIFFRMLHFGEWDVAEFSMAKYVAVVAAGAPPFRAIPVFPSRMFRQSSVYVAANAGIARPGDLQGRRVGIPEWGQTAGVYARAYLQHQCGVSLREIQWVQAGVNEAGRKEKVDLSLPAGVAIERVADRSLTEMLLAGDLDAIISAREPGAFLAGDPRVVRLWPDSRPLEEAYFRATGIFPIMHVMVVKSQTLDANPWIAMNLFTAFDAAKKNSLRGLSANTTSRIPVPWSQHFVRETQGLFGEDCWPYGLEPNRRTLEAFLQYCCEQGITGRKLQVHELFPKEFSKLVKV
jgi:4,5-dihydroxyphthalate decarboxylase